MGPESHSGLHRFERTLVAMAHLVRRKERRWQMIVFGRALILSDIGNSRCWDICYGVFLFLFFGSTFVMVLRGGGEEGKGFVAGQC